MGNPQRDPADRFIKWAYWVVLTLLAVGAARTLLKLARGFGWLYGTHGDRGIPPALHRYAPSGRSSGPLVRRDVDARTIAAHPHTRTPAHPRTRAASPHRRHLVTSSPRHLATSPPDAPRATLHHVGDHMPVARTMAL